MKIFLFTFPVYLLYECDLSGQSDVGSDIISCYKSRKLKDCISSSCKSEGFDIQKVPE